VVVGAAAVVVVGAALVVDVGSEVVVCSRTLDVVEGNVDVVVDGD
jgi:hypothetical protein